MEKKYIYEVTKNHKIKDYTVILTFKSEITGRNYIVYTDNQYDSQSKLKIYASYYNPDTGEFLGNVENIDEWNEISKLLDKVFYK